MFWRQRNRHHHPDLDLFLVFPQLGCDRLFPDQVTGHRHKLRENLHKSHFNYELSNIGAVVGYM